MSRMLNNIVNLYRAHDSFQKNNLESAINFLSRINMETIGKYYFITNFLYALYYTYFYDFDNALEFYERIYNYLKKIEEFNISFNKKITVLIINNYAVINFYKKNFEKSFSLIQEIQTKNIFEEMELFNFLNIIKRNTKIISEASNYTSNNKSIKSVISDKTIKKNISENLLIEEVELNKNLLYSLNLDEKKYLLEIDLDNLTPSETLKTDIVSKIYEAYRLFREKKYFECLEYIKTNKLNIKIYEEVIQLLKREFYKEFQMLLYANKLDKAKEKLELFYKLVNEDKLFDINIPEKLYEIKLLIEKKKKEKIERIEGEINFIFYQFKLLKSKNDSFIEDFFSLLISIHNLIGNSIEQEKIVTEIIYEINKRIEQELKYYQTYEEKLNMLCKIKKDFTEIINNYNKLKIAIDNYIYENLKQLFLHLNNNSIELSEEKLNAIKEIVIDIEKVVSENEIINKIKELLLKKAFLNLKNIKSFVILFPDKNLHNSIINLKNFDAKTIEMLENINSKIFNISFFKEYFKKKLKELFTSNNPIVIIKLVNILEKKNLKEFIDYSYFNTMNLVHLNINNAINVLKILKNLGHLPKDFENQILDSIGTWIIENKINNYNLFNQLKYYIDTEKYDFNKKNELIEYLAYKKLNSNLKIKIENNYFNKIINFNKKLCEIFTNSINEEFDEIIDLNSISYKLLKIYFIKKIIKKINDNTHDFYSKIKLICIIQDIFDDYSFEMVINRILKEYKKYQFPKFREKLQEIINDLKKSSSTEISYKRVTEVLKKILLKEEESYINYLYSLYETHISSEDYKKANEIINEILETFKGGAKMNQTNFLRKKYLIKILELSKNLKNEEIHNMEEFLKYYYQFCDINQEIRERNLENELIDEIENIRKFFNKKFRQLLENIFRKSNVFNQGVDKEYFKNFYYDFKDCFQDFFNNNNNYVFFEECLLSKNLELINLCLNNFYGLKNNLDEFYNIFYKECIQKYVDLFIIIFIRYYEEEIEKEKEKIFSLLKDESIFKEYEYFYQKIKEIRNNIMSLNKDLKKRELKEKERFINNELEKLNKIKSLNKHFEILFSKTKKEFILKKYELEKAHD